MTDKERINKVVEWSGLTSNAFAIRIGYKTGASIYNKLDGRRPITPSLITKITNHFPEISKSWLVTGEGGMLKSSLNDKLQEPAKPETETFVCNGTEYSRLTNDERIDVLLAQNNAMLRMLEMQVSTINNLSSKDRVETKEKVQKEKLEKKV
jgi:hypothetical protein